jgi:hypothetical protein
MTIILPDPFPGRCKNHRWVGDTSVRCLEYEGTSHVCKFPKSLPPTDATRKYQQSSSLSGSVINPKPWVKPED